MYFFSQVSVGGAGLEVACPIPNLKILSSTPKSIQKFPKKIQKFPKSKISKIQRLFYPYNFLGSPIARLFDLKYPLLSIYSSGVRNFSQGLSPEYNLSAISFPQTWEEEI